ncbi:hypothetical protein TorRG33x02_078760 [Trema orientale]|uniref:Uncharacterized protein n=1 Tax=Trema orientale TaxID=63057 RepID=A0A2P5FES3_TREOI|nr:hypothetical protein TorRG33x02_078760 [Trema orientale]
MAKEVKRASVVNFDHDNASNDHDFQCVRLESKRYCCWPQPDIRCRDDMKVVDMPLWGGGMIVLVKKVGLP